MAVLDRSLRANNDAHPGPQNGILTTGSLRAEVKRESPNDDFPLSQMLQCRFSNSSPVYCTDEGGAWGAPTASSPYRLS
jgi:hypothetical protein